MAKRKRYVIVGVGSRSGMFIDAIVGAHRETSQLVGLCDTNQGRMDLKNHEITKKSGQPLPTFNAQQFDRMIDRTRPDDVIVTSVDATHDYYICRAMELGCDVVTEKPMTIDEVRCQKILQTQSSTGRNIRVTFNYRYAPPRSQLRKMLMDGVIGEILSVDFSWMLDTRHGADYFRRWHRRRENSGSLLVHKATHHFDLVNWWLEDVPEEVFCHGSLRFYRPQRADEMGLQGRGERCRGCPVKDNCPFYLDLEASEEFRTLYLANEGEDGYFRDRCVFSDEIDIWDNMSLSVSYRRGAVLNYLLHSYSPWEGYRIALNGTKGRIEHHACENTYISGDGTVPGELTKDNVSLTLIPAFSKPQSIEPDTGQGGHGGGDPVLLADIFDPQAKPDPFGRRADHRAGAYSVLIGVAACHSIDTGKAIKIADLLGEAPLSQ